MTVYVVIEYIRIKPLDTNDTPAAMYEIIDTIPHISHIQNLRIISNIIKARNQRYGDYDCS